MNYIFKMFISCKYKNGCQKNKSNSKKSTQANGAKFNIDKVLLYGKNIKSSGKQFC